MLEKEKHFNFFFLVYQTSKGKRVLKERVRGISERKVEMMLFGRKEKMVKRKMSGKKKN